MTIGAYLRKAKIKAFKENVFTHIFKLHAVKVMHLIIKTTLMNLDVIYQIHLTAHMQRINNDVVQIYDFLDGQNRVIRIFKYK